MAETKEELVEGLSLDDEGGQIKLISSDQESVDIERKHAFISKLVKTSLENDPTATELPLKCVTAEILQLVCKYMDHHKGVEPACIDKPLRSKLMADVCKSPFDAKFIDDIGENRQQLYDLILAANYMDIKSLLHLGCAKVASLIKGQPLDKIKEILAVKPKGESKDDEKKD
jgi:S-phase kinase-associated protein 1